MCHENSDAQTGMYPSFASNDQPYCWFEGNSENRRQEGSQPFSDRASRVWLITGSLSGCFPILEVVVLAAKTDVLSSRDRHAMPVRQSRHRWPLGLRRHIPDSQDGVQKTLDQTHRRQECSPGIHRGLPAIGIHGLRVIIRLNLLGFPLKLTIGRREILFACAHTDGCPPKALFSDRSGNIDLFPGNGAVFFIGSRILLVRCRPVLLWCQPYCSAPCGCSAGEWSSHLFQTHALRPRPEPLLQKEDIVCCRGITRHIRHHKRRTNLPHLLIRFRDDSPNSDALFHGFFREIME